MNKTVKRVLLGLLVILVVMQFFRIDKTLPPSDPSKDFINITKPSAEVAALLKVACYDCHSHQTEYPWYTNVAPVSWWIEHHIEDGRKHFNFSIWGDYDSAKQLHKLEEAAEEVGKGHMPLPSYTWGHAAAKLSDYQRKQLQDWFNAGQIGMRAN